MKQTDTIAAIATPSGYGGIGIIRISGPMTGFVASSLLGKVPLARLAEYLCFRDNKGNILDRGIALFFPSPHSFTGEDVLELQGHGGPIVLDLLLQSITTLPGVRIAQPGEFSERAFLNNKLDLAQAESISDLINAKSEQAARSAIHSLQGAFSEQINKLIEGLTNLRVYIEAMINFPEEVIASDSINKIRTDLHEVILSLKKVYSKAYQGKLLREGSKIVIAGKPNAGKSTILNALTGYESAIVTGIPGTTRDVLRESICLDGIPLHIIDTAGLRDTSDEIEKIGVNRAWKEIQQADHVLLVVDSATTMLSDPDMLFPSISSLLRQGTLITVIRNKIDLTNEKVILKDLGSYSLITLSARSKIGMDLLRAHLQSSTKRTSGSEGVFLARRRHLESLKIAKIHLYNGEKYLEDCYPIELLAEELRLSQQALGKITGQFSSIDLLKKIFSRFCIGK